MIYLQFIRFLLPLVVTILVQEFVGVGLAGVLALFLFEAPGIGIIETVHGIAPNLSALVREIMVWCIPIPPPAD